MDNVLAAGLQMAISLGFHMVFAALGIGLPLLMLITEGLWLRRRRQVYLDLAKKWARATGLLFAIGAVSGTALSFELGLLWPPFMEFAGPLIGPAFALAGYAFFIEAIFLGLYLYGWDRLKPLAHWLCGIPVAASGAASGVLVMSANSWMQDPTGFRLQNGAPVDINPVAALMNPSWGALAIHLILASYMATAFLVAAVYAWGMLRGRSDAYHSTGLALLALALLYWLARWRKRDPGRWMLRGLVLSGALAVAAMEAGWIVTEVGRQPWIIYNVMLTAQAVTPAPGVWVTFSGFVALYVLLAVTMVWLLLRLATGRPVEREDEPGGKERTGVAAA